MCENGVAIVEYSQHVKTQRFDISFVVTLYGEAVDTQTECVNEERDRSTSATSVRRHAVTSVIQRRTTRSGPVRQTLAI